jgi:hypothetical protein
MAKQPSTQSKARATSGALETSKAKTKRLSRKLGGGATDSAVEADYNWKKARKETLKLKQKQNKERFKIK